MVKVEAVDVGSPSGFALKLQAVPAGNPEHDRDTFPLIPFCGVNTIQYTALAPSEVDCCEAGTAVIQKSGVGERFKYAMPFFWIPFTVAVNPSVYVKGFWEPANKVTGN